MQALNASGNPLERRRVLVLITGPSLTKQSFAKECNINTIMGKFEKTGNISHLNNHNGGYGNYIGYLDYHASLNKIHEADQAFNELPPLVRSKFHNDPAQFLEFAQNSENLTEMREMGLAPPERPKPATDENQAPDGTPSPKGGGPAGDAEASTVDVSTAKKD